MEPQGRIGQDHFFTVDVEEHFQVSAFDGVVSRDDWDRMPSRVVDNTVRILDLLDEYGATATFFVLGWVAEKYPELVRRIVESGHEAASHGYSHRLVSELTAQEFRHDVRLGKSVIENATGRPVLGYRAPSFSIRPGMEWVFDVLVEEGHTYDSSLFPIRRVGYGYRSAPPIPHVIQVQSGHLFEFPLTTTRIAGMRIPAAGGAYLRHLPLALMLRALREHEATGVPAMVYIHPWELDTGQPRLRVPPVTKLRHYGGLERCESRVRKLLSRFQFTSVESRLPLISRHADIAGIRRASQ